MCVLFVYTLLKVLSCYHLSVLPMSVMGFQNKIWIVGWVGGGWYTLFFSRWPLRQRPDLVLAEVSWVCNMTK